MFYPMAYWVTVVMMFSVCFSARNKLAMTTFNLYYIATSSVWTNYTNTRLIPEIEGLCCTILVAMKQLQQSNTLVFTSKSCAYLHTEFFQDTSECILAYIKLYLWKEVYTWLKFPHGFLWYVVWECYISWYTLMVCCVWS